MLLLYSTFCIFMKIVGFLVGNGIELSCVNRYITIASAGTLSYQGFPDDDGGDYQRFAVDIHDTLVVVKSCILLP